MEIPIEKPVLVVGQGPSVEVLDHYIARFFEYDCYWASVNRFSLIEDNTLAIIGRKVDIAYVSAKDRIRQEYERLKMKLSTERTFRLLTDIETYHGYDWPNKDRVIPIVSHANPAAHINSLTLLIMGLIDLGFKDIALFGCDGGPVSGRTYYKQSSYREDFNERERTILRDSKRMNKDFYKALEDHGANYRDVRIVNCCPDSNITLFDRMSVKEFCKRRGIL